MTRTGQVASTEKKEVSVTEKGGDLKGDWVENIVWKGWHNSNGLFLLSWSKHQY